jgi:hypothetical protein
MKSRQNQSAAVIAKASLFGAFAIPPQGMHSPLVGIMPSLAQELQNSLISPVPVAAMLLISSGYRIVAHRLRPILSPI